MVRFIEFERLELNDREITFQIRNVKWGTKIEFGKVPITRGNCVCYSINHIIVKSVGCPALSFCNGEKICFFLQGDCHEDDNEIKNYWLSTTEEASEIYETLLSMATNAEDFTDSPHLQGDSLAKRLMNDVKTKKFPPFDRDKSKKEIEQSLKKDIEFNYSIKTDSVWEHFYLNTKSPSLYDLRTPPKPDNASLTQGMKWVFNSTTNAWEQKPKRNPNWINELMDAKKARDYMGVYSGIDLGSNETVQTEGFDYTQGVWQALKELRKHTPVFSMDWGSNDIPKANNKIKIKGEEKMNLRKEEKLTVEQAVEKFELVNAYVNFNESDSMGIRYYNNSLGYTFYSIQENGETQVWTEGKVEDENGVVTDIRYTIEEGTAFIQKLNLLKPYDKMIFIKKYAEKPKFTLGEKVIYTKTDVNLNGVENDYPEEWKKQILQTRIENTKQIGIITKIQYNESGAIVYELLTNKYGGWVAKADNLSSIKE